ncbi:MAG: phosphate uptake regulator PhoU [Nanoarchaeota archaeon]|nr:phosphate uptake regulator PhoU [Nanoarchaeota archaeon]
METRKLIKFGKNSYVITLNSEWIRRNGLTKGDHVHIIENENNILIESQPLDKQREERIYKLDVEGKTRTDIKREIVTAYINNFSIIEISGEGIKDKAKTIKDILHNLVALAVIEQDTNRIIAKDFLNMKEISITALIRKMDNIIKTMIAESKGKTSTATQENIDLRDHDVNRLHILSKRTIKHAFVSLETRQRLKMDSLDLLKLWRIVENLEEVADSTKRVIRYFNASNIPKAKEKELIKIYEEIEEFYNNIMKAFYNGDMKLALKIAPRKKEILKKLNEYDRENWNVEYVPNIIEKFKYMTMAIQQLGRPIYELERYTN